jgi:hypothetical protein
MKGPRNTITLSDSVHHQLNMYALAASAAGVSVLALPQPAECKIIYTHAHKTIVTNERYNLDLNHDGVADFIVSNVLVAPFGSLLVCAANARGTCLYAHSQQKNEIWGKPNQHRNWAYALAAGVKVEPNPRRFLPKNSYMAGFSCDPSGCTHPSDNGPWKGNVRGRYLGLKFIIGGQVHYGWARLNVSYKTGSNGGKYLQATLTGYAYETIANKPIIAGQEHGKDEATLGRLALGASDVVSRQK